MIPESSFNPIVSGTQYMSSLRASSDNRQRGLIICTREKKTKRSKQSFLEADLAKKKKKKLGHKYL